MAIKRKVVKKVKKKKGRGKRAGELDDKTLASNSKSKKSTKGHRKDGTFRKGHVPNPTGRPKGSYSLTGILRDLLRKSRGKSKQTQGEELMKILLKEAKKGNPKLLNIVLERMDGKVPDHIISTDTGPLSEIDEDKLRKIINAGRDLPPAEEGKDENEK